MTDYADKILIVFGFVGILIALQLIIKSLNRSRGLSSQGNARIKVVDRRILSPRDRVELLNIDGNSVLVVLSNRSSPTVISLGSIKSDYADEV